jgi:hypothetical protein
MIVWNFLPVLWLVSWKNPDLRIISLQRNGHIVAILCDVWFIYKLASMENSSQEGTSARLGMSVYYCEGPSIKIHFIP